MAKIKVEITAYYPSNEGVEGGYLGTLGDKLDPDKPTCAAPKEVAFHKMITISGTNTEYDGIGWINLNYTEKLKKRVINNDLY